MVKVVYNEGRTSVGSIEHIGQQLVTIGMKCPSDDTRGIGCLKKDLYDLRLVLTSIAD